MKKREEMKEEEQGGEYRKGKREQVDRQSIMKGRWRLSQKESMKDERMWSHSETQECRDREKEKGQEDKDKKEKRESTYAET